MRMHDLWTFRRIFGGVSGFLVRVEVSDLLPGVLERSVDVFGGYVSFAFAWRFVSVLLTFLILLAVLARLLL